MCSSDLSQPGDGHLIVVTGFTPEGDVMANDPGVRLERVRRVFSRAAFEAAWRHSRNAIYLVHPENRPLPPSPERHW